MPKSKSALSTASMLAPSSTTNCASRRYGPNMRLPTKPRQLPTSTPILPMVFDSCMQVAITSLPVFLPRTISSRRITLAGLKKCVPITDSGREVVAAISSMLSVEVFEARIAPGLHTRSSSAKISFLSAMPSKTASMAISTAAKPSKLRVGSMRFKHSSTNSWVKRPRLTELA